MDSSMDSSPGHGESYLELPEVPEVPEASEVPGPSEALVASKASSVWDKVFSITDKPIPVLNPDVVFDQDLDARKKFEAFGVHAMELSCRSKQFQIAFTETVCQELSACNHRIRDNAIVMNGVKKTVDSIQGELHDLKAGLSNKVEEMDNAINEYKNTTVSSSEASKYTDDEIGSIVWPLLPLLIDGLKGIAGWVPVDHTLRSGQVEKLVVLSVPMVQFLVRCYDNGQSLTQKIDGFLKFKLKRYNYSNKMKMSDFISIMLETPFKPYVHTHNCTHVAKGNVENYIIMESEYFKGILADIHKYFPDRPLELPEKFPDSRLNNNLMYQDWALTSQSSTDTNSAMLPVIRRCLSFEERSKCPSMLTTWWRECYGGAMVDFFDMDIEGKRMGHVRSGKYVKDPAPREHVRSFDTILKHEQKFVESDEVPGDVDGASGGVDERVDEPVRKIRKKGKKRLSSE